jgi:hypothetical protein
VRADGRFVLEQETNAHAVLPETQWRGYRPPAEPPGPAPGTWGEPAPALSAVAQAALELYLAAKVQAAGQRSQGRPGGRPGAARPGIHGPRLVSFRGVHEDAEKPAPELNHTDSGRFRPIDQRKEGALNKKRLEALVPRTHGQADDAIAGRTINAEP